MKVKELLNNLKYEVGDLVWVVVNNGTDYNVMRYVIEAFKIYGNKITAVVVWDREYPIEYLHDTREEALELMNKLREI